MNGMNFTNIVNILGRAMLGAHNLQAVAGG